MLRLHKHLFEQGSFFVFDKTVLPCAENRFTKNDLDVQIKYLTIIWLLNFILIFQHCFNQKTDLIQTFWQGYYTKYSTYGYENLPLD